MFKSIEVSDSFQETTLISGYANFIRGIIGLYQGLVLLHEALTSFLLLVQLEALFGLDFLPVFTGCGLSL